ncbi:MAG: hypothetical protein HZB41_00390 [Ignavibacteriae bacterium]|nr:hypothetical protein [Ignavibacteriota bacterium]
MNIGIFEIDHYEFAYSLCRLFDYRENKIFFFVNQSMYEQLRSGLGRTAEKCYWFVMEERDTLNFFLNKVKHVLDNEEVRLLFLNSIYSDFGKYSSFVKSINSKTVITVHNINNWIKPADKGIKGFFAKRSKKNIIKNCSAVNVFGEELKKYFNSECKYRKHILTLPYSIYEHSKIPEITSDRIEFVIPGSIDSRRRDYNTVLNSFEKASQKAGKISLTLAGKPVWDYGRDILTRCKKACEQGMKIKWFDDFVPHPEFEKIMHACDVVISPINKEMPFSVRNEVYGITKATGGTFDMARYAKPGIMPVQFNTPDELSGSILKYASEEELTSLFIKISTDINFLTQLKQKALNNSRNFTVDIIRERIEPEIDELFKTMRW